MATALLAVRRLHAAEGELPSGFAASLCSKVTVLVVVLTARKVLATEGREAVVLDAVLADNLQWVPRRSQLAQLQLPPVVLRHLFPADRAIAQAHASLSPRASWKSPPWLLEEWAVSSSL